MAKMLKFGLAFPGSHAEEWDEEGASDIIEILISHQTDYIKSIQFTYRKNGKNFHSKIHGSPSGSKFNMVKLDYPNEYLTSISGEYIEGCRLTAIAFGTNKGKYGPFGGIGSRSSTTVRDFCYDFGSRRCFGGFHGTIDKFSLSYLCTIGVYIKPDDEDDGLSSSRMYVEPEEADYEFFGIKKSVKLKEGFILPC